MAPQSSVSLSSPAWVSRTDLVPFQAPHLGYFAPSGPMTADKVQVFRFTLRRKSEPRASVQLPLWKIHGAIWCGLTGSLLASGVFSRVQQSQAGVKHTEGPAWLWGAKGPAWQLPQRELLCLGMDTGSDFPCPQQLPLDGLTAFPFLERTEDWPGALACPKASESLF